MHEELYILKYDHKVLKVINRCLFEYGPLNGNESLIEDIWHNTNIIIHKFLLQKQPMKVFQGTGLILRGRSIFLLSFKVSLEHLMFPEGTLLLLLGTPHLEHILTGRPFLDFSKSTYIFQCQNQLYHIFLRTPSVAAFRSSHKIFFHRIMSDTISNTVKESNNFKSCVHPMPIHNVYIQKN